MRVFFIVTILFFTPLLVQASPLTLETALEKAKKNPAPQITTALWAQKEKEGKRESESFLKNPTIALEWDEVPNGGGLGTAVTKNYSIKQEIPFPTKLLTQNKIDTHEIEASRTQYQEALINNVLEVKETYYSLFASLEQKKANQKILAAYLGFEANMKLRYSTDKNNTQQTENTPLNSFDDLLSTRIDKDKLQANIYDNKHQTDYLTARLNVLMGEPPMAPIEKLAEPTLPQLTLSMTEVEKQYRNKNLQLQTRQLEEKAAKAELIKARQSWIPDFEIEATYRDHPNFSDDYALKVGLSIPLWITGPQGENRQAYANWMQTKVLSENEKREGTIELHNLIHHASEHYKIVSLYKNEIVGLSEADFKRAQKEYEINKITARDLLIKLKSWQENVNLYWQMWADYQIEFAKLKQLIGENL